VINKIMSALRFLSGSTSLNLHREIVRRIESLQCEVAALHAKINRVDKVEHLEANEFRAFSQFGDDGIIQMLIAQCPEIPHSFIEFGVESYQEANTRFLLQHDNWRGLVLDGSEESMAAVRSSDLTWRHDLTCVSAFVTRENVNDLFASHGFVGSLGLLSIDIDGNDYWVWEAICSVEPTIVVVEYNSVFGNQRAVSIPYDPKFQRAQAHHSNLYWGCSLRALELLGRKKGYDLVGSNSAGNNAYFVRRGVSSLAAVSVMDCYRESRFRESRDSSGALTFLSGPERLRAVAELPLVDVSSEAALTCGDLLE